VPQEGDDQVAVDAAEPRTTSRATLIARGAVTLTRGDTTLRADEVRYDRTQSVAEARGNVVLIDPEATVEGDAATSTWTTRPGRSTASRPTCGRARTG
jgi:lipopolysaccharide assembly outer membrane protein LptD (OstA)